MTFSSGIFIGAVAMLPVMAWLGLRLRAYRAGLAHMREVASQWCELNSQKRAKIDELAPLATLGRTRRASYDADNTRRKASRAKKREAGE